MDIVEALKNIDLDKFAQEFHEEVLKKEAEKQRFWSSPLCETMIKDMVKANEGFDEETFLYFPDKVKSQYGWEEISNDDIQQFINVMADNYLGLPENYQAEEDEDCMFDNFSFEKRGINVFVMFGQGRAVSLSPASVVE